ncbi:helix-turn-helix domain-containing protein [Frigidibacter albus]|uniref:Helix-turn-helix domain-containing protein n=1 Tax=Frigidibacter albus TaxID=1465486 RepID=A0A6L8VBB3_9RHOB|nr:Rrf2 family transcriptional regulator [Frigidibacter albus]MZQ87598.1 helix-turn-helix domain-containing protein [Frigidibacter albus]NBE29504.1 helix-turn-helix domain-containing protein [Frigidibacter albus]GGH44462.1 Rrf2 family transcriptional regulator [Frigidibacter albus]
MRQDTRLSRLLHVLLHMAQTDAPMTSQQIAVMLGSNAVVVRRIMAGLRDGGYVEAERGHGGGWRIIRRTDEITVLDVYRSLGSPDLFAFGFSNPKPPCLVEQSVNATIEDTIQTATTSILGQFGALRLSQIEAEVRDRMPPLG